MYSMLVQYITVQETSLPIYRQQDCLLRQAKRPLSDSADLEEPDPSVGFHFNCLKSRFLLVND